MIRRYEVMITVLLDAEDAGEAASIAESLVVLDPSLDDNDIDFVVSDAIQI